MATPEERQITKELMLAYMSHEKTIPSSLFTSVGGSQQFEAVWERILHTVSGQPPATK